MNIVIPAHQTFINESVAYHLGVMKRLLSSGEVDDVDVEIANETHFVINMNNGRKVGFLGTLWGHTMRSYRLEKK